MLSRNWDQRKARYDFVVVGSGYGGAITAARIATADLNPKPSVCILERGREWPVGSFPDDALSAAREFRSDLNPLGLYEMLVYQDVSVMKGNGLGGTSLVNANVAIRPDRDVFETFGWPRSLSFDGMSPYYDRAAKVLDAGPHPRWDQLKKVQALGRRARQMGREVKPLDIAVNFHIDGANQYGVDQKPCIDCGDCVTGCNVGAKNTLPMNYLPMAKNAGAEIFTQAKVEWIEKLAGGGWKIHGKHYPDQFSTKDFTIEAAHVVLAAGSVNSTEILLRSQAKGLALSPRIGTNFSGNGNFFGLAYNGNFPTQVLGFGNHPGGPGSADPPGPTIVGVVKYNGTLPADKRFAIEDLSFPSAAVELSRGTFALLRGEDSDAGDEQAEQRRVQRDIFRTVANDPQGALNHTMLYLCAGVDNAKGTMVFEQPFFEPEGRMRIIWDEAGRQQVFTRLNEELRRHSRAQGASFVSNPLWSFLDVKHLMIVHPLGGCPIGEDYLQGAVDPVGRVFSGDGSVHDGLFVSDGALIPSALGVNPFLTISAVAEHIVERKIQQLQGVPYAAPAKVVSFAGVKSRAIIERPDAELERLFRGVPSLAIDACLNKGQKGQRIVDVAKREILNDEYWKGFFPKGHILNRMSAAIFTGFKKRFFKEGNQYKGITSDTDGRINARNTLEELNLEKRTGDLDPGRYILLRYIDPPWQGFYDVFRIVNDDLMLGRVYMGEYPNGTRLFTFPMCRRYGFVQMTVEDHQWLWDHGSTPSKQDMNGVWRMDAISNANHSGGVAHLGFDLKPDGRLESRYLLMGLLEGLLTPTFVSDHFQLHDFTPFHDEIRKVDQDFLVGRYVVDLPAALAGAIPAGSLGILHQEGGRFGFYYTLTRTERKELPRNTILRPFLEAQLPDGLGMTFDEEMTGWYQPAGGARVACSFQLRMMVRDVNEFIDGVEHEARCKGTIRFDHFEGEGPVIVPVDDRASYFKYLRVNPETAEAEMIYHLEFSPGLKRKFVLEGRKHMQKDGGSGLRGMGEILSDYTTLFSKVLEGDREIGAGVLKFQTFENLAAMGSMVEFLRSFQVSGTDDPLLKLQAQMRFVAFTAQFVLREYDPASLDLTGNLREDVRAAVARGADTADFFSTQPSNELQSVMRAATTMPLDKLLNTGALRIDWEKRRIWRDSFWKGSFATDSLMGWEERARNAGAQREGAIFAGGSFWKRFDRIEDGAARGHVVNYELAMLPGDPSVREIVYPNDGRKYFAKGDKVLLLNYRNDPYRPVYDAIKVVDPNNAIGVMHLGNFPDGIEFATFVMARNNYPFEKMSVEDHHRIFADPRTTVPGAPQLEGAWEGNLVFLTHPNTSLLNQANPAVFRLGFKTVGGKVEGRYRFGLLSGGMKVEFTDEFVRLVDFTQFHDEIRLIDEETLIGKWVSPELSPLLLPGLRNYLEPGQDRVGFYYILKRAKAGAAVGP